MVLELRLRISGTLRARRCRDRSQGVYRPGGNNHRGFRVLNQLPSPTVPATSPDIKILLAAPDDAAAIRRIYNIEVDNYPSTFDVVPRTLEDQRQWLAARSGVFSTVVATAEGAVVGFASLSPYKDRAAYNTTVENSVYVSRDHGQLGIGRLLMEHLLQSARESGFHSVIARIEASSEASMRLHESTGFKLVGIEREVGRKFNRWLDVAIMQLML